MLFAIDSGWLDQGSDYDVRFSKFFGLGDALVPSEGSGTIRDCVFMLNIRGVDYQSCTDHTIQNCLFMGNNMGVRDYNGSGGEVVNCTFDHNIYGVSYEGTSLTVRNCLFHTSFLDGGAWAGIRIYNGTVAGLAESYNAFYGNNQDIYDVTSTPVSVVLHDTDYASPANEEAELLTADPYDSAWVDFDDRFRLGQSASNPLVDGGDPASSVGSFYSTALAGFADDGIVDIGYHYPRIVRFVDGGVVGGNDDGTSWDDAYEYLQDALDEAALGGIDAVCVAEGTYKPDNNETASFVLVDNLALYGGFEGNETIYDFDIDDRNLAAHVTILSGDVGTPGIDTDNCYHVVTGADGAVLDGFTVTKGYADESGNDGYGGGMYNEDVSPVVTNCIFNDNSANYGGGMFNDSSSPTITNCLFFRFNSQKVG